MMNDSYVYIIIALMPLAAVILTVQVNPYNALVIRGILGAIAALVYAVLGAADVALTEALVGTMLAITLYAVSVRSSLVMRLGVLNESVGEADDPHPLAQLIADLKAIANRHHLRLELVPYPDLPSLSQALMDKEVHATCIERSQPMNSDVETTEQPYQTAVRIRRLYNILQNELTSSTTHLTYHTVQDAGETH
jgi:putative multicomponent Na+:H+ antiporter subunit B